jgi:protein phosphatase
VRTIEIPSTALVMLVGASGSGKSSWARRNFLTTQVVSSDHCRALVSDREEDQQVNREAFAVFYTLLRQRLRLGRLTVADSTALEKHSRMRIKALAGAEGRPLYVVAFPIAVEQLIARMADRSRRTPEDVIRRHAEQAAALMQNLTLEEEGYQRVYRVAAEESYDTVPLVVPDTEPDGVLPAAESGRNRRQEPQRS